MKPKSLLYFNSLKIYIVFLSLFQGISRSIVAIIHFSLLLRALFLSCHFEALQGGVAISLLGFPHSHTYCPWVPEIASPPKIRAPRNDNPQPLSLRACVAGVAISLFALPHSRTYCLWVPEIATSGQKSPFLAMTNGSRVAPPQPPWIPEIATSLRSS